jgi:hypothetical protein
MLKAVWRLRFQKPVRAALANIVWKKRAMIDKFNGALLTGLPTRRQAIARTSVALAGLAVSSGVSWAGSGEEISRTDESIHQERVFTVNRKCLFDALTDTNQFDKVTKLGVAMNSGASGNCANENQP